VRLGGGQVLTAALVLAILAVLGSALFGEHGVTHLLRLNAEQRKQSDTTFSLLQQNARLLEEVRKLRNDELYLEGLARRQLGLVKPNETVYRSGRPLTLISTSQPSW
jgi:cell division protein FtsB